MVPPEAPERGRPPQSDGANGSSPVSRNTPTETGVSAAGVSSTLIVAVVVFILSMPLGTLLGGWQSESAAAPGGAPGGSTWREKLLVPHNPLPPDVGPHQVTVQLCVS